jgi:hypothetical protein
MAFVRNSEASWRFVVKLGPVVTTTSYLPTPRL